MNAPTSSPERFGEKETEAVAELARIVARLRADGGCPWNRAQTPETLRPYILEEAYEVVEAIDRGDAAKVCDELGDLLFQVVLQSQIASETGRFDLVAVARANAAKIVRRHPHVFAGERPGDIAALERRFEEHKHAERAAGGEAPPSILAGVPVALPALLRARKVQERAARVGFDWERKEDVLTKLDEERRELGEAIARGDVAAAGRELGDLLFAAVNLSRFLRCDAEDALRAAIARFCARFEHMEEAARRAGRSLRDMSAAELDALWNAAKAAGAGSPPSLPPLAAGADVVEKASGREGP